MGSSPASGISQVPLPPSIHFPSLLLFFRAQSQSIQQAGFWRSGQGTLILERQIGGSNPASGISQVPPPPSIHFPSPPLFLNTPRRGPVNCASWGLAAWYR